MSQNFINGGKNNINPTRGDNPHSFGKPWREKLTLEAFLDQGYVPKTMSVEDIDKSFKEWVEKELEITYDGNLIPTQFLMSIQRLSEFGKSWKITDSEGGLILNFKTISRELTPQQGTQQGSNKLFNIPGEVLFEVCKIPVVENGVETYDILSMKQPIQLDLKYSVGIFSTKMEVVNKFNTMMIDRFKSLQAHIRVRDTYYISMVLDKISDETKWDLETRRYYSQTYEITVRGYLLQESDFIRERMQTRMLVSVDLESKYKPCASIVEDEGCCGQVNLTIDFPVKSSSFAKFRLDEDLLVTSYSMNNIRSFTIKRNHEQFYIDMFSDKSFRLYEHEVIELHIKKMDIYEAASITFKAQTIDCPQPKEVDRDFDRPKQNC